MLESIFRFWLFSSTLLIEGRLDQLTPYSDGTNRTSSVKRKSEFNTPSVPKVGKVAAAAESPAAWKTSRSHANGDPMDGTR